MQEAFAKLKGVDIFSLKSYMEPTNFGSFNGAWVLINELFVNLFFFILNAVVGFFSLLIRILEKIDLYTTYKTYVFHGASSIWHGFTGSNTGNITNKSLVGTLLLVLAFYLFYQYFFSKGSFSRTLLHVCLVLLLALGYFGTVAGTSGGLYLLDTVNNVSKDVTKKISGIKVDYAKDKSIKIGKSMSDSYIAETSYKAYVFVNTGQENGKYKNSQDGKEEAFDDSKVLGTSDKNGNFKAVKAKDRSKYLDDLGDGANDDGEKNRWVSAMPDFIFTRMFYVIFKIVEAFVLAVPIILIQLLNVVAQILVLTMILLFPVVLLMSFVPRMQELVFGVLKVMFGGLIFPAITTLFTRKEPSQPETVMPPGPTEAPITPEDPEPIIPPTQTPPDNFKPIEEENPTPTSDSPIMSEGTPSPEDEFQTLREEWISPFKQHRINTLERRLDAYKDPQAMYKAQGSNVFTRAYRQTMTRDDKIRANIERRDRLTQRLNQLRGE